MQSMNREEIQQTLTTVPDYSRSLILNLIYAYMCTLTSNNIYLSTDKYNRLNTTRHNLQHYRKYILQGTGSLL